MKDLVYLNLKKKIFSSIVTNETKEYLNNVKFINHFGRRTSELIHKVARKRYTETDFSNHGFLVNGGWMNMIKLNGFWTCGYEFWYFFLLLCWGLMCLKIFFSVIFRILIVSWTNAKRSFKFSRSSSLPIIKELKSFFRKVNSFLLCKRFTKDYHDKHKRYCQSVIFIQYVRP